MYWPSVSNYAGLKTYQIIIPVRQKELHAGLGNIRVSNGTQHYRMSIIYAQQNTPAGVTSVHSIATAAAQLPAHDPGLCTSELAAAHIKPGQLCTVLGN